MKSITYFSTFLLLFVASVLFTSCDKDDETSDTTPPIINVIYPTEGAVLTAGEKVVFQAEFSDNTGLQSYKVNIHSGSGHSHGDDKGAVHDHDHGDEDDDTFEYNGTWNLPGEKTASVDHTDILIDKDAANGDYHFMVYCSDKYGNESYVVINVVITGGEDHDHDH